jgi:predicted metal-dependent hydrolase
MLVDFPAGTCGFTFKKSSSAEARAHDDLPWKEGLTVRIIRHPRARRYLLRLQPDGMARLVIPRRGSRREGLRFLERNTAWLLDRFRQWQARNDSRQPWTHGTEILFRGERVTLRVESESGGVILRFGDQALLASYAADYRDVLIAHLRTLAEKELPRRTRELAQVHGIPIQRVSVRAQKTRWGSCSIRGTISLNWRLVQAPPLVCDYLIIHELMHRREMNHSARYWKLVAEAFPEYRTAEQWLKRTRLESLA